jgi:hypothetical protein
MVFEIHLGFKNDKYYVVDNITLYGNIEHSPSRNYALTKDIETIKILFQEMKSGKEILIAREAIQNNSLRETLEKDDIKIQKVDDLKEAKKKALADLNNRYSGNIYQMSSINIFQFISATLKLMDAGYFITDSNREEKYLEIIQSDDEDLIDALKDFLDVRDNVIDRQLDAYRWYRKSLKKIRKAKTVEDLEKMIRSFQGYE